MIILVILHSNNKYTLFYDLFCSILGIFEILNIPIGMLRILNVPWANWNSYLEGGGLQGEEIVKSTLFCKVHYVLNSDIKEVMYRQSC